MVGTELKVKEQLVMGAPPPCHTGGDEGERGVHSPDAVAGSTQTREELSLRKLLSSMVANNNSKVGAALLGIAAAFGTMGLTYLFGDYPVPLLAFTTSAGAVAGAKMAGEDPGDKMLFGILGAVVGFLAPLGAAGVMKLSALQALFTTGIVGGAAGYLVKEIRSTW